MLTLFQCILGDSPGKQPIIAELRNLPMSSNLTNLRVLYEDNHLLVIDKPPLLATMGVAEGKDSLVARARQYIKLKFNKPGNVYLGVVSRLDSFVSGVVVFARTSKAASRLTEQFRQRSVDKTYWAIVPNHLQEDSGTLEDWLIKDESRHRMVVTHEGQQARGAKLARLHHQTIGRRTVNGEDLRLLKIKLETGRKHQIRVQLEHAGCPIVGDRKYGSGLPFKRGIALHSRELVIQHPTTKAIQSFQAETPPWWNVAQFALS